MKSGNHQIPQAKKEAGSSVKTVPGILPAWNSPGFDEGNESIDPWIYELAKSYEANIETKLSDSAKRKH